MIARFVFGDLKHKEKCNNPKFYSVDSVAYILRFLIVNSLPQTLLFQTAKNLILAGINVTILDSSELVEEDLNSIFYAQIEEVGQKVRSYS
jgi:hypothetical protein